MKNNVLTFVVAHGDIAAALTEGVQKILGPQKNLVAFSNQEDSLPVLLQKMQAMIEDHHNPAVVCFTDLKGGSCWTLANLLQKNNQQMTILSGVNLPMLVTYCNNLSGMDLPELLEKTTTDGCRGIKIQAVSK